MSDRETGPRWMRVLLVISLALNLGVIGAVAGLALRHDPDRSRPVVLRDVSIGAYSEALSPEDRQIMRQRFHEVAPGLRDLRKIRQADQERVLAALRAQPFAPEAVAEALEQQRARLAEGAELGHRLLVERITGMTDAERAAFADRLQEVLSRPRRGGHRAENSGGAPGR